MAELVELSNWVQESFGHIIVPAIVGGSAGFIGLAWLWRRWLIVRGDTYDKTADALADYTAEVLKDCQWATEHDKEYVDWSIRSEKD